ncbi:MAG: hypothetical protein R3208_10930 [Ketobacteraceae bacterium]|nr:hypothetical protein [Ketobacteraceae bacterium]
MEPDIFNVLGFTGTFLYLLAYGLLCRQSLSGDSLTYVVMNLLAASLVCFSLLKYWNAPAFAIQVAWIAISLYGIIRRLRTRPGAEKPGEA